MLRQDDGAHRAVFPCRHSTNLGSPPLETVRREHTIQTAWLCDGCMFAAFISSHPHHRSGQGDPRRSQGESAKEF